MLRGVALLLLTALPLSAHADEPWKRYAEDRGVVYEKRSVEGSSFDEYRARATLPAPPQVVADAIWRGITEAVPKTVRKRTVLQKSANEYVVYDQLDPPVVKDRDVTVQIDRRTLADGTIEIAFHSTSALGPPPSPAYVRIPMVRGAWILRGSPDGTALIYRCYSEAGGSVPAFLVRGVQADQVKKDIGRMLSRLPAPKR